MDRSVLARMWVLMVSLVVVSGTRADQPRPEPEPAVVARLQELGKAAKEHKLAGRVKETIAAWKQLLDLERSAYGDGSDQALGSRQALAKLYEQEGAFVPAREEREEVLEQVAKQHGEKHWKTIDARLELKFTETLARLSQEQRKRLREADKLRDKALELHQRGKDLEAVEPLRQRLDIDRAILGTGHLRVAEDFIDLASCHWRLNETGIAEAYTQRFLVTQKSARGENHPRFAEALILLGLLASDRSNAAEALSHYTKAAEILRATKGENSQEYAAVLNNLAGDHNRKGEVKQAEEMLRQSIAIKERLSGDGTELAITLTNLGVLLENQKRFDEAESHFHQALNIRAKSLEHDHPDYLDSVNRLADLAFARMTACLEREEFVEARVFCGQLCEWRIRAYGETHYLVAQDRLMLNHIDRLATLRPDDRAALKLAAADFLTIAPLWKQGKTVEALELAEKVYGVRKQHLSENDLETIRAEHWVGFAFRVKGDYDEAERHLRAALEKRSGILVRDDPDIAAARNDLITLFQQRAARSQKNEQFDAAIQDCQREIDLTAAGFGDKHWKTTDARLRKAHAEQLKELLPEQRQQLTEADGAYQEGRKLQDSGQYQEAQDRFLRAIALERDVFGEDRYTNAKCLYALGRCTEELGDQAGAETYLRQSLALDKQSLGTEHPIYANCLVGYARAELFKGNIATAEPLILEAVDTLKRLEGETSKSYAVALSISGELYRLKRDSIRQELCARQALEVSRQTDGETHKEFAVALQHLAAVFQDRNEWDRAEATRRQSLEILRKTLGESHSDFAQALSLLAEVINKQNKLLEAIRLQTQVLEIQQKAFGPKHRKTLATAETLAEWLNRQANALLAAEDFPAASQAAEQVIALRTQCFGETDWRVTDARLNLRRIEQRASLSSEQRQKVIEVDRWITESDRLVKDRKLADAKALLEKAHVQVESILGDRDPLTGLVANRLGNRYHADSDYDKAESMYRQDLAICEQHRGREHPFFATSLHNLAGIAEQRNDLPQAERLFRETLELRRKARGPRHAETLSSLERLATLFEKMAGQNWKAGDYTAATNPYRQALQCKQERYGEKDWHTTDARLMAERAERDAKLDDAQRKQLNEAAEWVRQGDLLRKQDKYRPAAEAHQKAVDLRTQILGPEDRRTVDGQFALAMDLHFEGDTPTAEPIYRTVIEWRTKALGEWHPDTATAFSWLGRFHFSRQTNYQAAEQELAKCLEIRKRTLGSRHEQYAEALKNLAELARTTGQFARAEDLGRQALEIIREISGETTISFANVALELGKTYQSLGDYARAEPLFRKSIEVYRKTLGERGRSVGSATMQLGRLYVNIGDHARAEAAFRETYAIYRDVFGEDHKFTTTAIVLLGDVARQKVNLDEAEAQYRRAMDIRNKTSGSKSGGYAECLLKLATIHIARKEYEQAEALASEALDIRKANSGTESLTYATGLTSLAEIRELWQDDESAVTLLRQVLAIRAQHLGHKHPHYAATLRDLGRVERKLGNVDKAETHLNQSLHIVGANLLHAADSQSERQQLLMAQSLRGYLDDYLSLALAARPSGEQIYQHVLAWKGTVFARQLHARELRAAHKDGAPELLKLYSRLEELTARLAMFRFTAPDPKDATARVKQVKELDEELERLESELAKRSADFRDRKAREALTPAQLQASLSEDTVLIDFLEFGYSGPAADDPKNWHSERRLVAFILRRGQAIHVIDLGAAQPVAAAVDQWRGTLQRKTSVVGASDPAVTLRQVVWQPLREQLVGAKTILISPDGPLCRLPFAALPGEKPDSYLIEENSLAVIPVPQLLPELLSKSGDISEAAPALLLLGNVDYGAAPGTAAADRSSSRTATGGPTRREFHPLEATAGEILVVKKHFEKRFREGHAELLEEADATEQQFRLHAPRHQWLHLATHGFFATPSVLASIDAQAGSSTEEDSTGQHPGLFSGLAMAGANAPSDPDKDDGILTALEVAQVDLQRVQLAVLSACETGLGEEVGGEGVLGLQRAFQVAGARGVVGSLWSVDDNATRTLMERFYENLWKKKLPRLEAMREAQLWMLQEGRKRGLVRVAEPGLESTNPRTPPYYWAAFVLSGDWR